MKKNTIKAFTLVEMLIVIVIIGILIAALMPRMQSAQWRARDVARKNDLSQIQTAIVTSQQDKWKWPWSGDATARVIPVENVKTELVTAWMSSVPSDPLSSSSFKWLWDVKISSGNYWYAVLKRNGTKDWWFILMAKTEIEWWSNWVVCQNWNTTDAATADYANVNWVPSKWRINPDQTAGTDIKNIHPCTKLTKNPDDSSACSTANADNCIYHSDGELRYIVLY